MNRFIIAALITVFIATVAGCTGNTDLGEEKPNILIIMADDAGYHDFGFQGSGEMETPNLDRLAKNGVEFTDAHVTASVCSPSRAGLLTGRYQQRFGHEANSPPTDMGMDTSEVSLADALKKQGYTTGIFGKWHLGSAPKYHPNRRGFDTFYGLLAGSRSYFPAGYDSTSSRAMRYNRHYVGFDEGYLTDVLGDSTSAFIERNSSNPFFAFLSFTAVHTPMHAKEEDLNRFEGHPRPKLSAMTWAMDRAVGNVVTSLERSGQLDNTLIFFLSDNGGPPFNNSSNEPLKGWKGLEFEGGHRVPFIVHWMGELEGGSRFDGLTSSMDIYATSLAAAGVEVPTRLDGVNLHPYLKREKQGNPHQKLYWRKEGKAAMRDGKWKLIRLRDYGYRLYNLDQNIGETVHFSESNPTQFEQMKADLQAWERQMTEPWWHERKEWRTVTWDIHKALMENTTPEKLRP
ncbi:MAG: sulfatase-like hydrolase/transferase [Balneolaceae bacterium]|nr:sulfatase-like hydrolase/transferase [Balneolaceae bacterium]